MNLSLKLLTAAASLSVLSIFNARAEEATASQDAPGTPESLIVQYFNAFKTSDLDVMASIMHDGELAKLKRELLPVVERGIASVKSGIGQDEVAKRLFSDTDDIETIRAESPQQFFIRFMEWVQTMNPNMKNAMSGATINPIGHVLEGDVAHVVYRVSVDFSGTKMNQVTVMSAKKQDGDWKLMMTGEIEGMGRLLQRNMK